MFSLFTHSVYARSCSLKRSYQRRPWRWASKSLGPKERVAEMSPLPAENIIKQFHHTLRNVQGLANNWNLDLLFLPTYTWLKSHRVCHSRSLALQYIRASVLFGSVRFIMASALGSRLPSRHLPLLIASSSSSLFLEIQIEERAEENSRQQNTLNVFTGDQSNSRIILDFFIRSFSKRFGSNILC